jgi:hypothetical protein
MGAALQGIYGSRHDDLWSEECIPVVERIAHLVQDCFGAWPLGTGRSYGIVTDNLLLVDQALARTHELQRDLHEARTQHLRDVALLRTEIESLRLELRGQYDGGRREGEDRSDTLPQEEIERMITALNSRLRATLGGEYAGLSHRIVNDEDFGGDVVELTVVLTVPRDQFRRVRERALQEFREVSVGIEPSSIVLLFQHRGS